MTNRFAESVVEGPPRPGHRGRRARRRALRPGLPRRRPGATLRQALVRLNRDLPPEALDDAFRKLTRADAPSLIERNRAVHRMLVDGVTVEYRRPDGSIAGAQARCSTSTAGEQRLARGQPVHRRRGAAHAPPGRGALRERPAARGDRAQEPGRRERHDLVRLPAASPATGASAWSGTRRARARA
jgi:hypothetical protein